MKPVSAFVLFLVCLSFSLALLSCQEAQETGGELTGPEIGYTISGTVQYWRDQSAAPGIAVKLKSAYAETTCVTDSSGSYCFTGLEHHVYQVIPVGAGETDYYFEPESTEVVISGGVVTAASPNTNYVVDGREITFNRFLALRYPEVILENNGPWKVVGVEALRSDARPGTIIIFISGRPYEFINGIMSEVWRYDSNAPLDTTDNTDNLLAKDLEPFICSEKVRIKSGFWDFVVTYSDGLKGLRGKDNTIRGICILPEGSLVLRLNSVLKVKNNSSNIITSVEIRGCASFWTHLGTTPQWSGNLLETEIHPGSVSENIYVGSGGYRDVRLVCSENSHSSYFIHENINVSPDDTVCLTFER